MNPERFKHLFNLVGPLIAKQDKNYRKSIAAKKRVVITFRYLAEDCSQQALSLGFRVGKSTVFMWRRYGMEVCEGMWMYVKEVCEALDTDWPQIIYDHYQQRKNGNK